MTGEQKGARRGFLRRRSLPSVALAGTTVLLLAGVVLPAPYVVESAGPTFNTVGSHDDKQLVKITGAPTFPSDGRLDLTTVYVTGGPSGRLNSINALLGWLDPSDAVIPEDTLYPPDTTGQQVDESNAAQLWSTVYLAVRPPSATPRTPASWSPPSSARTAWWS